MLHVHMSGENDKQTQLPSDDVQELVLETRDGPLHGKGQFIGYGTSRSERHRNHVDGGRAFAQKHERCSACRWNEVRIFKFSYGNDQNQFLIHTLGVSIVPGEFIKCRTVWTNGGYELVEMLTVRPHDGEVFLPGPAARALASASEFDENVRRAYVDRAVV
jgi:hypothetical protein